MNKMGVGTLMRRRIRSHWGLLLVGTLAFAAGGCGGGEGATTAGTTSEAGGAKAGSVLIGESSPVASNPNLQALTHGGSETAKQLGWRYRMLDANLSSDKQVSDVDTLVNLGVKGLITLTLDPGAADAAYKRAADAGIPVVGINSESKYIQTEVAQETDTSCIPSTDAARFIAERIPGAKVLVIGGPPVPSIRLRTDCFVKAAQKSGLQIVEQQDNVKDTASTAQPIVENMLTKHPDVQAIFAYNDPSALGAAAVVRAAGRKAWSGDQQGIVIIGINATPDAIAAIKAKAMTATYDPNSADAGAAAAAALAIVIDQGKPRSAMPKRIVIKAKRWDADNVSSYVSPRERKVTVPTGAR